MFHYAPFPFPYFLSFLFSFSLSHLLSPLFPFSSLLRYLKDNLKYHIFFLLVFCIVNIYQLVYLSLMFCEFWLIYCSTLLWRIALGKKGVASHRCLYFSLPSTHPSLQDKDFSWSNDWLALGFKRFSSTSLGIQL
jgi:hypothetical protein